jgi:dihydroorotase
MTLSIRKADDMHLHLRQGKTLKQVLPWTAQQCSRAVVMPNTIPPITSAKLVEDYRAEITEADGSFTPLMVFKIMADMDDFRINELKQSGAVAGKLYPQGSTTNAEDGPSDIEALYPVFANMEKQQLVLCIHAEDPASPVLQREQEFLPVVKRIVREFPNLKIVFEHVSSSEAVDFVLNSSDNIAATVTLHHLLFTLDDMLGGSLDPHLFCKPLIKEESHRNAIRQAVFSGNKKFFFGSDSAPHSLEKKLHNGAAGIFSAPVLLPALAMLFEENEKLDLLEAFVSEYGAAFYGLELNENTVTLEKRLFEVPSLVGEVVPLFTGRNLEWRIKKDS